jgi:hypothetical protein
MQIVTIKIKGKVDAGWAEWFEGFQLTFQEPDETILTGQVTDQAAFYGLIGKLRDLGLQVLAVNSAEQSSTMNIEKG